MNFSGSAGSNMNSVTMANRVFQLSSGKGFGYTSAGDIVYLCGNIINASYTGLGDPTTCKANGSFQVPVGLTLRILAVRVSNGGATDISGSILYGDDSKIVKDGATVPTNPIYKMGGAVVGINRVLAAVSSHAEYLENFTVPAGKYPAWGGNASTNAFVEVIGVLE